MNVLEGLYASNGNFRVQKELNYGISPRQLRRLFDEYIGFSPKAFAKIIQLQHAVQHITDPDYSYFDSGFYDQAHYIREMKAFSGLTPHKLRRELSW